MISNTLTLLCTFLLSIVAYSQTVTGNVVDAKTGRPIETASVYFDNTTIGTTTNEKGDFSIEYNASVQSALVISYLGYENVIISNYREQNNFKIQLKEVVNELETVVINTNDGLTRRQKLRIFRKEFLGYSKYANSCKILNEDVLNLRYNGQDETLSVSARAPILVKNKALQYEIKYDIIDFEIEFRYLDRKTLNYTVHAVTYSGTSFYKPLDKSEKRSVVRNREDAYIGSTQHFLRALYKENLKDENYAVYYKKFRVNEWAHFNVEDVEDSELKKVTLKNSVIILYDNSDQTRIISNVPFYIDKYGNYAPIAGVYFSGVMGDKRIGDSLPSDYGLVTSK